MDSPVMMFRESFRGYNKEDVNTYIEEMNLNYSRRFADWKTEVERLKTASGEMGDAEEIKRLRTELSEKNAEMDSLKEELKKKDEEITRLTLVSAGKVNAAEAEELKRELQAKNEEIVRLNAMVCEKADAAEGEGAKSALTEKTEQLDRQANAADDNARAAEIAELRAALLEKEEAQKASAEEIEGLRIALAAANGKLADVEQRTVKTPDEQEKKSKLYDSMSARVGNILIVANANAEQIVKEAKEEAERIKTDAANEAAQLKDNTAREMAELSNTWKEKMKEESARCISGYRSIIADAENDFKTITASIKEQCDKMAVRFVENTSANTEAKKN